MQEAELNHYNELIAGLIGKGQTGQKTDNANIRQYYTKSSFFYRKAHSPEGAMHLPIEFSRAERHHDKLRYQAKAVHQLIGLHGYKEVLELGCGMGFNTNYLSTRNPGVNFTGMDLTPYNLQIARANAKGDNVRFIQQDFDSLSPAEGKYDLIFSVEALCHSKDIEALLQRLGRLLTPNGRIVIFDGYVRGEVANLNRAEQHAYALTSWGFAMDAFQHINQVLQAAQPNDLQVEEVKDYSQNVLPNFFAFQRGAKKAFRYPRLLKGLMKLGVVSSVLIKQLSAGLFGPYLIEKGFLGYYKIVLRK